MPGPWSRSSYRVCSCACPTASTLPWNRLAWRFPFHDSSTWCTGDKIPCPGAAWARTPTSMSWCPPSISASSGLRRARSWAYGPFSSFSERSKKERFFGQSGKKYKKYLRALLEIRRINLKFSLFCHLISRLATIFVTVERRKYDCILSASHNEATFFSPASGLKNCELG